MATIFFYSGIILILYMLLETFLEGVKTKTVAKLIGIVAYLFFAITLFVSTPTFDGFIVGQLIGFVFYYLIVTASETYM